ncbi:hypothetical protein OH768_52265 [Streptomyces sp. NBC_01622]|uniref:hypothetical protein n=1 Tax=Streptomyces sp. NBC_01622 TaxID=2975903 RepID=UPI00386EEBA7|nr:hypothetical protein OH768_52265 [Streptomyces sp. NBC_01622]
MYHLARIRRILLMLLFALPLALFSTTPTATGAQSVARKPTDVAPGWYYLWQNGNAQKGHPRIENADGISGLRILFPFAYVWPHKGHAPLWISYSVTYSNRSNNIMYFTCNGVSDPSISGEWLKRGSGHIAGYVGGEVSYCSQHPDANFTLGPGRHMQLWVLVHNVPWSDNQVSIEWQQGGHPHVRTGWFKPYVDGARTRPAAPQGVCPYDCS